MKVLVFNWRCWLNPEMGGAEVFTHEVTKRWATAGHEVTLFTAEFDGCKKEETLDGVQVVRSGGRLSVFSQAKKFYKTRSKTEPFDLVIDEINTRPFFAPSFTENGTRVVALIHQLAREYWFYETSFPLNIAGYYYLENRWLRKYRDVPTVTVSNSTQHDLEALGFQNVFVASEGLNFKPIPKLTAKSGVPVVVYAGRLKKTKRPSHAIEAFKKVREKLPEAELWVIGDGPLRYKLERLSCDGVKFFGRLNDFERRELIKQSWVLVNPGIREGWGLNVIEANALGVPTVAYSAPGLKDSVQDNVTGLLVESGDVAALAEAQLKVLTNEKLRVQLAKNALEYSHSFDWDVTAKQVMEFAGSQKDEL